MLRADWTMGCEPKAANSARHPLRTAWMSAGLLWLMK